MNIQYISTSSHIPSLCQRLLRSCATLALWTPLVLCAQSGDLGIGREVAIARHLKDGDEFKVPLEQLLKHGQDLFVANWTPQEGGGRPLTKGNGNPLRDPSKPLVFPRNFNRVSAPDANSCAGCHNSPLAGGNGDIVANVFVTGQRFDFARFDDVNTVPTVSSVDESGKQTTLQSIANSRATPGMFGAGFIEMLARQMTVELQAIRDSIAAGQSKPLVAKGISFGTLARKQTGDWDTSQVQGLAPQSLGSAGPQIPPSLVVRPFHQAGNVVSIREFSNNAYNHHHGMQSTERFGVGTDPDGDGFADELTRADITAAAVFQATMAVPGRVIPNHPEIEAAVLIGEERFSSIGCAVCHTPSLPLTQNGWIYTEPNPFHPANNLLPGAVPTLSVDLTQPNLPKPRLTPIQNVVHVPAFTDLKLHDICSGPDDPNAEPINMNQPAGSPGFFAGNRMFLTRKLWGVGKKPNYFHHGQYTTMRQAILAHAGEALESRNAFDNLPEHDRNCVIEFLKTLQVLPPNTAAAIVDENGAPKLWPPARFTTFQRQGDHLNLQWAGSGSLYQVERTATLQSPDWKDEGAPITEKSFSTLIQSGSAFYRVRVLSP